MLRLNLQMLEGQFGALSENNTLQRWFPALPDRPVYTGGSWNGTRTSGSPFSLREATTYDVKVRTATEACVAARGTAASDPGQSVEVMLDAGPAKMSVDRKVQLTGDLKIDFATGLVTSGHLAVTAAGTESGVVNGQTYTSTNSTSTDITFSWHQ